jgi:hypothetical protein
MMICLFTAVTAAMSNLIQGESFDQLVVTGGFSEAWHGIWRSIVYTLGRLASMDDIYLLPDSIMKASYISTMT